MKIDTMKVSTARVDVEHGISPPMQQAITLPLSFNGLHSMQTGITVYVAVSAFSRERIDDTELTVIARELAIRINHGG